MPANSGLKVSADKKYASAAGGALLNLLEPFQLIQSFLTQPPLGFRAEELQVDDAAFPVFKADFDLLTTLDDDAKPVKELFNKLSFLRRLHTFPTLFLGTTATEYANYPEFDDYDKMIGLLLAFMRAQRAELLILKDIPRRSPLLSKDENDKAELLIESCKQKGAIVVEGQALAYVSIDFPSIDVYMQRLSKVRRKEFRKKLKESAHVKLDLLDCGSPEFFDQAFLCDLYKMYMNVFQQSEIHFDILSPEFFRDLLQSKNCGGKVFLYRVDGRLIGYNICFVHENRLLDKYVGFVYPDARANNLYFLSWFKNLEFALANGLDCYIAGWTDPAVKAALGASFTMTRHAVFIANPILRSVLKPFKSYFESDAHLIEKNEAVR